MNDKKTFAIAMFGIPEPEQNVLKNIFKLSLYRTLTYKLASADLASQILLVDAENPDALVEWRSFKLSFSTESSSFPLLSVMVTKDHLNKEFPYILHRPFIATRVLSVLDQAANQLLAKPTQERIISERPIAEKIPDSSFTALLVDDSSTIRKQVELELKLLGIRTDAAESGEQAFDLLSQNNYDIIFLDVVLPGVDGYHICKTIKKDKDKKKTPVIMLTSKSSPFDRIRGALAGCNTYITKPVSQSSFQKVVKKYLKSS
jgi:two-component system cell cycle response regulator